MKLTVLTTALAAGAGIAQVAAVPIRVIMVSSVSQERPVANVRFGHAVQHSPAVATMVMPPNSSSSIRRPCSGRMSRFRQKGIEISNAFRGALGLPLIDTNAHLAPSGPIRILPINAGELQFLKPNEPSPSDKYVVVKSEKPVHTHPEDLKWFQPLNVSDMNKDINHHAWKSGAPHVHHGGPHHRFHHYHHGKDTPFVNRLHYSLINLGLWEGRAVAFVLGCGIGVLLRMFWVLAIVAYRIIKRRPEEEDEYTHITVFEEVEEASPPHYTYPVDEKVAIEDAKVVEQPTTEVAK